MLCRHGRARSDEHHLICQPAGTRPGQAIERNVTVLHLIVKYSYLFRVSPGGRYASRLGPVDRDDGVGEGPRCLLRQIVADAATDDAVLVSA